MQIQTIPIANLSFSLIPVGLVLLILLRWKIGVRQSSYAIVRMLAQLLLVGYVLSAIFSSNSAWVTLGVLLVMVLFSSWIALGTVKSNRLRLFLKALFAIATGGGLTFWIVVGPVLNLQPWYQPRYAIPLGGMIFANTMTSISLAAERFYRECKNGLRYIDARNQAFNTALIPTINALLAVGLVSLPGMMTGQILSGVSPFIAARYQIMVMMMIFASAGLSTACFLALLRRWKLVEFD